MITPINEDSSISRKEMETLIVNMITLAHTLLRQNK
jgi:hypothetical protein